MEARMRVAAAADAAAALAGCAPVARDTASSFEWEPPTLEEMERQITHTIETLPWLVCEAGGEVLHLVKQWLRQAGSEAYPACRKPFRKGPRRTRTSAAVARGGVRASPTRIRRGATLPRVP